MEISLETEAYFAEWDESVKAALSEFSHDMSHVVQRANDDLDVVERRFVRATNGIITKFNTVVVNHGVRVVADGKRTEEKLPPLDVI